MKTFWALLILPLTIPALYGRSPALRSSTANAEIRAVLEAQVAAWNRNDIDAFMQGYWKSDKTEFVGSNGILRGWQAVFDRYRKAYPDGRAMGTLTFSGLEITVLSPTAALVLGEWKLDRAADHPGGVFTLVFRKFPEGWRIINDHTSAVIKK
ncbi:MAG: YybH family protein [Terriglobia bacterium]